VRADPAQAGTWLTDTHRRSAIKIAVSLVPFAGIAFLWFVGVIRDRVGRHEDRFFATVFLGSGLLFVAMLFAAGAVVAGLLAVTSADSATPQPGTWQLGRDMTFTLLTVYGARMAAVFMITCATIILRSGAAPRWLAMAGYLAAACLLMGVDVQHWLELLFPTWILVLSVQILLTTASGEVSQARNR